MEQQEIQLESRVTELAKLSVEAFCEDLNGMLGAELTCSQGTAARGPLGGLKKPFARLGVVYTVKSTGLLNGGFFLVFDRKGIFILPGTIVMMPEKRIEEQVQNGSLKEAQTLADSIGETGNLLVGSWDRVFRAECKQHKHFLQNGTFIGDPWAKTEESFQGPPDQPCLYITWELNLAGFPPFQCAAVFPESLLGPAPEAVSQPEAQEKAEVPKGAPADASPAPVTPPQPQPASAAPEARGPVTQAIEQMVRSLEPSAASEASFAALPDASVFNAPAEQFMNRSVCWCREEESIENVLHLMHSRGLDYALVEKDQQFVGILSRSDMNAAVSPYLRPAFSAHRRPLDDASLQIRVKWFMSRPVFTVPEGTSLFRVLDQMNRCRVRALPVLNTEGTVTGIVTVFDLFTFLLNRINTLPPETQRVNS